MQLKALAKKQTDMNLLSNVSVAIALLFSLASAMTHIKECSKMATLTFDSTQTTKEEILKRIALAGYDYDKFHAPDDKFSQLRECCRYERTNKTAIAPEEKSEEQCIRQYVSIVEPEQGVN